MPTQKLPVLSIFCVSFIYTLKTWILEKCFPVIALTGISGIGKTTLAVKLIQQIKDNFDYVIWRSLKKTSNFAEFQADLIEFFSQSQPQNFLKNRHKPLDLIKYLQKHHCLVVLDNIHNLFSSGELAGKYKPEYKEYDYFQDLRRYAIYSVLSKWNCQYYN